MCTQYIKENVGAQAQGASKAMFLEAQKLTALHKKPKEVKQLEKNLQTLKDTYVAFLE